jgi:hypothetical protein
MSCYRGTVLFISVGVACRCMVRHAVVVRGTGGAVVVRGTGGTASVLACRISTVHCVN